jgi:PE-PGRS C-terminal aspartyl peptidase-like domain
VVDVSVGGGRPVPVVLDTGSSGLLLEAAAIGPNAQASGRTVSEGFVGTPRLPVTVVSAQVNIGGPAGVTTPYPVAIGSVASDAARLGFSRCGGAQGLLGVGVGNPGPPVPLLESPLVQLTPSLSEGYTITLTRNAGTLLVGKPVISPTSVSLPLLEGNGTYPNGHQAYQRGVTLCWTVGTVRDCGLTDIDSGFSFPAIRPDFLPTLPHRGPLIAAGTQVSITAPNGAALQSFTTVPAPPDVRLAFSRFFGSTEANTGIGFFFANSVGFDVSTGHVVITPK